MDSQPPTIHKQSSPTHIHTQTQTHARTDMCRPTHAKYQDCSPVICPTKVQSQTGQTTQKSAKLNILLATFIFLRRPYNLAKKFDIVWLFMFSRFLVKICVLFFVFFWFRAFSKSPFVEIGADSNFKCQVQLETTQDQTLCTESCVTPVRLTWLSGLCDHLDTGE